MYRKALLLAAAAVLLAAGKQLAITDAGVHQIEDGPFVPAGTTFVPGEVLFFSCQLEGYQASTGKKVSISFEVHSLDPQGVPVIEPLKGKIEAELSAEDKNWKPKIRHTVLIPPMAASGVYKLRVTAKDEIGGSTAVKEVPFEVHGHEVEPSDTLAVRNFRFFHSEEDTEPLKISSYRPGETLWARFDITGYKFGPGNQVDVSYRIAVYAPGDRLLFEQKEPSEEKRSSFYPMRYVPCQINLSLQPTIRAAEYAIVVTAEDHVGGQHSQTKTTFRVE